MPRFDAMFFSAKRWYNVAQSAIFEKFEKPSNRKGLCDAL